MELSEVLDLSEQGLCLLSPSPLQPGSPLDLSVDLSSTGTFLPLAGQVVWFDPAGRAGITFAEIPPDSLHALHHWLESGHASPVPLEIAMAAPAAAAIAPAPSEASITEDAIAPVVSPEIAAVPFYLPQPEAEWNELVVRAQAFTGAAGVALAWFDGHEVVCCAISGTDTPSVGSSINLDSGFSAQAVRSGRVLVCHDAFTDERTDHGICEQLSIRSILAVPLTSNGGVAGLLSAFSPRTRAFVSSDAVALQRLAQPALTLLAQHGQLRVLAPPAAPVRVAPPPSAIVPPPPAPALPTAAAPHEFDQQPASENSFSEVEDTVSELPRLSRLRRMLLGLGTLAVAAAVFWIVATQSAVLWSLLWKPRPTTAAAPPPENSPAPSQFPASTQTPITQAPTTRLQDLRTLAEQGDAIAQYSLGSIYARGDDAPQDLAEATRWFSRAAAQGHPASQGMLGAYYWAGRGVPQDLKEAYFWSALANAGGDAPSHYRLAAIASRLSRAEVVAAQQRASDWIRNHQLGQPTEASSAH
jgi:putative methionine-R-sulfoxide reductase with GAF domain